MSTGNGENSTIDTAGTRGTLSEDVVVSRVVQSNDGTLQVSLPKDGARDLGISAGEQIVISGKIGDRGLKIKTSSAFLDNE